MFGSSRFLIGTAVVTALILTSSSLAQAADSWNQWRGPARDGSVPGAGWPENLQSLERQWNVDLGKGYPGPVLGEDRVFVVETVDADTVGVRALNRRTGKGLWEYRWSGRGSVPFFAKANGDWVRSTPAFDGKTLYVGDMSETLLALDGQTGALRWKVDLPARFKTNVPDFGFASSPLLVSGELYVQAANSLIKLNPENGETIWRSLENSGEMKKSGAFSSPVEATIGGKRQIVTQTREALYGVDPESGGVLWSQPVPNFRGMNILTPIVVEDSVFTSPYRERSYLFKVGGDGREEGEGVGDRMEVKTAWEMKSTAYMSSPVLIDGHAYMHLANGRLECIDLDSGEARWRSESFGKYWSMAHQGDKILGLDSDGTLYLLRANPEKLELLGERTVGTSETWGHIAVDRDQIFVRELNGLSVYRWDAGSQAR